MREKEKQRKREAREKALGSLLLGFLLLLALLLVFPFTPVVHSQSLNNGTNYSVESRVNVTNAPPTVQQVLLYRTDFPVVDDIILQAGDTVGVQCNATVQDRNGFEDLDLNRTNATIYYNDAAVVVQTSDPDNNHLYQNTSCDVAQIDAENATVSCGIEMEYYADNHTEWFCNVSVFDLDGFGDANRSEFKVLQALYAINVTTNHSTNAIDFGNMAPGDVTGLNNDRAVNITNVGNLDLSIGIDGWANVPGDNLAMNCTIGNISADQLRYNITPGFAFAQQYNLTANAPAASIPQFTVSQRVDDSDVAMENSTNLTYWKLQVPIGIKGFCNGTVMFTAL